MTRDSTTSEEKSSRSYWGFVLWPAAVVVLYVLSYGPAVLLVTKGQVSDKIFAIYTPLEDTLDVTHLWPAFGKYVHLWCPDAYDENGKRIIKHHRKF